jgi:hypothetical protein
MYKSFIIATLFLIGILNITQGQEKQLSNDFQFENGVFMSYEAFKSNTPDYTWETVQYDAHASKEKRKIQFRYINAIDTADKTYTPIVQDSIWGISVNGVPYIRVFIGSRGVSEFVALRTRGRICYFTYEGFQKVKVPLTVYDPRTGEPVFVKEVINEEEFTYEKMMQFETGEVGNFNLSTFKEWIANDKKLLDTINALEEKEATGKMYKSMLIYNDRNPVYLEK